MIVQTYESVSGRTWVVDTREQAGLGGRSTPFYGHELGDDGRRMWVQRAMGGGDEDWERDREHLRRAYRIGQIGAVAACPNIAAPVDLIDPGFDVLIVSEVADTVLDHELRRCALTPTEADELERALTRALEVLHGEGLVHCDVREDNVLRFGDTWTLADLGGVVEHYAPIEAIQKEAAYRRHGARLGAPALPENDHFALAVVLDHARNDPPTTPSS